MALGPVAAFWAVSLLLIAVPGADWAFTLGAALQGRAVAPAVAGLVAGYLGMTVVVAVGVGAVVATTPVALTALTVTGGAYLTLQGARNLWHGHGPDPAVRAGGDARGAWGVFVQGAGVSGLNPKGLLIFVALLPQFARPHHGWPLTVQLGLLGVVFTVTCAAFYFALGTVARGLLARRPGLCAAATRLAGAGMIVVGAALVLERLVA